MKRTLSLLALLVACNAEDPSTDDPVDTDTDGDGVCGLPIPAPGAPSAREFVAGDGPTDALAASVDTLGADLLPALASTPNGVFSAPSVHGMFATLLPAYEGADAELLRDVLAITQPTEDHHTALAGLLRELDDIDRGWRFGWGTGFWHRPSLAPTTSWSEEVAERYDLVVSPLDFQADGEAARTTLNQWVSEATACLIPEFYPPGYDFSPTLHIAIHAMALEAKWAEPFDAAFTTPRAFLLAEGGTVQVPTMESETFVGAADVGTTDSVIRLPYQGEDLAMYLVVPTEPTDPRTLIDALTPTSFSDWAARPARDGGLALRLPKWTTTSVHELIGPLEGLGYAPLRGAPLPALCEGCQSPDIVRQVAVVFVDEEGTRAAAATSGESTDSEPSWTEVDRPFLWFLRDDASGTVLWVGWVNDPR